MAKPSPIFPQRVQVVNRLQCTRLAEDRAILATDLGQVAVPLEWWLEHKSDASIVLVVAAVEAAPRHQGATLAGEDQGDGKD